MQRIFDFLQTHNAKKVAIFSHIRGDGDSLGAQTGLAEVLTSAGFCVALYNQDVLSDNYRFLERFSEIIVATTKSDPPDVCIAVDCASLERIGDIPPAFSALPWFNVDHHVSNTGYGEHCIVESNASSTCEVLSQMAFSANVSLSNKAATAFYTGISTDTGSFLFPNATMRTFETAAKLLSYGANKNLVQLNVFENTSRKQIDIYKHLYAHIQYIHGGDVAYCVFSKETLETLNAMSTDMEGVVSLIKEIQGVELAVLFTELKKGQCKISLRSKEIFDANRLCGRFGGGGHVRASGASLSQPLDSAVSAVLGEITDNWEVYINGE